MDESAIAQCLKEPIFTGTLRGIVSIKNFAPTGHEGKGDCYVFNTNTTIGEHWFALLRSKTSWYLFDSSSVTPKIDHDMIINRLKCDVNMQTGQLQGVDSMTCGEHSVTFLCLFMALVNSDECLDDVDYCNTLISSCNRFGETPDEYVTDFVYNSGRFPRAKKPPLRSVSKWLADSGM